MSSLQFFYNQHANTARRRFRRIKSSYDLLNYLGVAKILFCFTIVLEDKTRWQLSESSKLELSEKISANKLTDIEDNNSSPLQRREIACLPLSDTLFLVCQKLQELCFWEVKTFLKALEALKS